MQTVPVEHSRAPRLHTVDPRAHANHGKITMCKKGGKANITLIKESEEISGRHIACNGQPDYIMADNMPVVMTT